MPAKAAGGAADGGNFPDLHLKMSKKIAQLTKVIYHLNTRNEDHEANVRALKQGHAAEVEEAVADAARKIQTLMKELEKRKEQAQLAAKLKKLKAQHEGEKAAALKEFAQFRDASHKQQAALQRECAEELQKMKKAVESAKGGFTKRVDALEAKLKEARAAGAAAHEGGQAHEAALAAQRAESDELVRQYNAKYNEMLVLTALLTYKF
jgi:hypothetical protein